MAILGFIVGGAVFFIWGITKQRNDAVNLEAARAQAEEITKAAQTKSQLVVKEAELKARIWWSARKPKPNATCAIAGVRLPRSNRSSKHARRLSKSARKHSSGAKPI